MSWHLPPKGLPKVVLSMATVTATALFFQTLEITQTKSFQTKSADHTSAFREPTTSSGQGAMPGVLHVWCCDSLLCFPDIWRQRPQAASFGCREDLIMLSGDLCPSECFFSKVVDKERSFIKCGIMETIPASEEEEGDALDVLSNCLSWDFTVVFRLFVPTSCVCRCLK